MPTTDYNAYGISGITVHMYMTTLCLPVCPFQAESIYIARNKQPQIII